MNETLLGGSHPGDGAQFRPNPFLDPENQRGWEFGANVKRDGLLRANDIFRLKAAYFDMDVDNYITDCGSPIQFCNSPGTAAVQGVEIQGTYDAGVVFAGLSYTYTDTNLPSQLNGAGAPSYLPEHILVATGELRLLDQKLTVGARVSYSPRATWATSMSVCPGSLPSYARRSCRATRWSICSPATGLTAVLRLEQPLSICSTRTTRQLTTPIVPFGPATPTNCFGSNLSNCSECGPGRTLLLTTKAQF